MHGWRTARLACPFIMGPVSELASPREAIGDEMKRKRFTEEQIIGILQEAEASGNIREVCRIHNLTETTFYRWRSKFGGMDVSEARRLKEFERENGELKRIVAEQALDIRMLKDVNSKKW
jgi:putative transposase